jgi:hypothetical protein
VAKDKEKPNKDDNFFERDIDPEVVARVDKLMSDDEPAEEPDNPATEKSTDSVPPISAPNEPDSFGEPDTVSAPLLPSDKLPDAVKKAAPEEKILEPAPSEDEPEDSEETKTIPDKTEEKTSNKFAHTKFDIEDVETEKAVDSIVKEESDRALALEDNLVELEKNKSPAKTSLKTAFLIIFTLVSLSAAAVVMLKLSQ